MLYIRLYILGYILSTTARHTSIKISFKFSNQWFCLNAWFIQMDDVAVFKMEFGSFGILFS